MGNTLAPESRLARPGGYRAGWANLAWKIVLALVILFMMSVDTPVSRGLAWAFQNPNPIQPVLILWGGLFVGLAAGNLFEGTPGIRWAWGALAVGAYAAMAIPGVVLGPNRVVEAIGPVAALTLAAHLGRRDLARALRDWGLVLGLSLYAALGVLAMWLVVSTFGAYGPIVFLVAVLFPPLVFEAALLVLRRVVRLRESPLASMAALLIATLIAIAVSSAILLNRATPVVWLFIFFTATGLLVGSALYVSLMTRPMIEAASGAHNPGTRAPRLGRALVELSHAPFLISLAVYIPLRILFAAQ